MINQVDKRSPTHLHDWRKRYGDGQSVRKKAHAISEPSELMLCKINAFPIDVS
jgi:hypothetical protein